MDSMKKNPELYESASQILKALSHPVRICIVRGLWENGPCNVSHMYDCLDIPQSTVSQHVSKLKSAGIIKGVRKGTEIIYELQEDKAREIVKILLSN